MDKETMDIVKDTDYELQKTNRMDGKIKLKRFKKTLTEFKQRAIKLACALRNYEEKDIDSVYFDEEDVEVNFTWYDGCGPDNSATVYMPYEDLFKDIDTIIAKKKQERVEIQRKKKEAERIKKQKELKAKEKQERANYERLKKKYEGL